MMIFRRFIKYLATAILIITLGQILYFGLVFSMQDRAGISEAIVVFRGSELRVQAGYALAAKGVAPALILSPATDAERRYYDAHYHLPGTVTHIIEPYARTTLANAWHTARLIQNHNLTAITLVTANYHMPRSLALLRLFLAGRGVTVYTHKVDLDSHTNLSANYRGIIIKLLYNEMLKCWGSLAEYLIWQVFGNGFDKLNADSKWGVPLLRQLLLMKVDTAW